MTSKNKLSGKNHIKYNHPKEFGTTKDFLDLLTKKEKTVNKYDINEDFSMRKT